MVLPLKKGVQKMTTITLKVSEADKTFMKAMAKFEGVSLSELIRTKTLNINISKGFGFAHFKDMLL